MEGNKIMDKDYKQILLLAESLKQLFPIISIDANEKDFSFRHNGIDGNCFQHENKLFINAILSDCRLTDDEKMNATDERMMDKLLEAVNDSSFNLSERDFYYTILDGRIIYLQMNAKEFTTEQIKTFFELSQNLAEIEN